MRIRTFYLDAIKFRITFANFGKIENIFTNYHLSANKNICLIVKWASLNQSGRKIIRLLAEELNLRLHPRFGQTESQNKLLDSAPMQH